MGNHLEMRTPRSVQGIASGPRSPELRDLRDTGIAIKVSTTSVKRRTCEELAYFLRIRHGVHPKAGRHLKPRPRRSVTDARPAPPLGAVNSRESGG